jgi:threonine dehydrogenase-like Zn-dependent dehydrogenase
MLSGALPAEARRRRGVDDATRRALQWFVMPVWIGAGLIDWWCHRRTEIERTAGVQESAVHMAMMIEGGLREAIMSCRNGGIVSIMGVYGGFMDKFPIGSVMNRSLAIKSGQCHAQRYLRPLLERIEQGQIDPGFVISHHLPLERAPHGYEMFKYNQDNCTKIVLTP